MAKKQVAKKKDLTEKSAKKKASTKQNIKKKDQAKLVAILSYITIIGWVIALVLNMNQKTKLGSFHLRQALIIVLAGMVVMWIPLVGWLLGIILFVLWIIGLIGAINGQEKEIPIIGKYAQDWFKGL